MMSAKPAGDEGTEGAVAAGSPPSRAGTFFFPSESDLPCEGGISQRSSSAERASPPPGLHSLR